METALLEVMGYMSQARVRPRGGERGGQSHWACARDEQMWKSFSLAKTNVTDSFLMSAPFCTQSHSS